MAKPNIIQFTTDSRLLNLSLSPAQETCLRSLYGLPLTNDQFEIYRQCTGRDAYHEGRGFGEMTVIAGARSGKDSRLAAPVAIYESVFGGHQRRLTRGERAIISLTAQNYRNTKIAFDYIKAGFTESKLLSNMVEEILSLEIRLVNQTSVVCFPCTHASARGWSIPVGILDEVGFFRIESQANSDQEVQMSIRRGMLNFPSPKLIKISTPYMKSGVLFEDFKRYFGKDSPDVLVWRAPSILMNPTLRASRLQREQRLDAERFEREYNAEFAEDLEAFLPMQWIEDAVMKGRYELPPMPETKYIAAVDPMGGGPDSFTLAIVHRENEAIVQDCMKGWQRSKSKTIDLEGVVAEIVGILKLYKIAEVVGDRYSGAWVKQAFDKHAIKYLDPEMDRSAAYLECEPLFAQSRISILDHPVLIRELRLLERKPRPQGKTVVDHPAGSHDDHSNALCLAAAKAMKGSLFTMPEMHGDRIVTNETWMTEGL